jgi:hypothetical protein
MHIDANPTDRLALTRTLRAKTPRAQSGSNSPAEGVGLIPFIGVGTFWVAALLRSNPCIHDLLNCDRDDSRP